MWREKVKYDRIRPTTWIGNNFAGQVADSYLGPDRGLEEPNNGTILAEEWRPYIRVMPHSEYPSGSACLCESWANMMEELFGPLEDVPGVNFSPNGKITLSTTFPALSSQFEPGRTPAEELTLAYTSWSEISETCGQSRLNGGMHFSAAVPAGAALCSDIGTMTIEYYRKLKDGITPEVAIDFDSLENKESRNCPQEPPASCGLEYGDCTNDNNSCCPDYKCEVINPNYARCRTDPNAGCIAEHGECTDETDGCCFGTTCVGNHFYRQCIRA